MITLLAGVIGAVWGGVLAKKRGGKGLDIAQYAAGFGIAFGITALLALTILRLILS
ncbi:hypothetical protein RM543_15725 [Roseicyclus sp. F158]|uniref:Apolipoprotein acyltransferase n=1 Tax=Tropicimonas omnivorans TaxID=3075590 RepID=A0ABU3DKB1_9RHOB|nr:hypothetical protein [Roseicyclus sp. F158]MDT0684135.1 hypothetical protein [Roseicyclus sp. F158]